MHCNLRVEGWRQEDPRGWLACQPTLIGKPHLPARGPSKQPRCMEDPREWHYLDSDRNLQKNPSTVSLLWESCFHGSFGKTSTVGFSCTTSGNCQLNLLFFFFQVILGLLRLPGRGSVLRGGETSVFSWALNPLRFPGAPCQGVKEQNVFLGSQPRQNFQLPVPRSSHKPLWEELAPEAPSSPMLADRNPYSC